MAIIKYIKNAIVSFTYLLFTNNDISIDRLGPKISAVIKFVWLEKNYKLVQINREAFQYIKKSLQKKSEKWKCTRKKFLYLLETDVNTVL